MELKRKIYNELLEWKNSKIKSALLIEGARRIGKSTIAEKFGKENYKKVIIIDFSNTSAKLKENFENLYDLDLFFQNICLELKTSLIKDDTLFIFDEVQKFPRAREAIKHLVKDGRFDYIETGSLISIKENVKDILIPSEEKKLKMYPLDFEEFLWACNEEILLDYIKKCIDKEQPLDNYFHKKAMRLFKEYMLVGGMPQSVVAYLENNRNFDASDEAKRMILDLYKDDIAKADKKYSFKVGAIFKSLPGFLSKHERTVSIKSIDKNAEYDYFYSSFYWLEDSMICNNAYKCTDPNIGFALNKDYSSVKCYMNDTGLLFSHTFTKKDMYKKEVYKSIMYDKLALNEGMFYENAIAQMIVSKGYELYFYTHYNQEKHRNDIEIDFMITNNEITNLKVIPIEVKSSKNYVNTSYDKFKTKFKKNISNASFIVHPKGFVKTENGYKVPPYMFFFMI